MPASRAARDQGKAELRDWPLARAAYMEAKNLDICGRVATEKAA
jgi:hypothetical protein